VLTNIGLLDKQGIETLASFIIVIVAEFDIKVHSYSCSKFNLVWKKCKSSAN